MKALCAGAALTVLLAAAVAAAAQANAPEREKALSPGLRSLLEAKADQGGPMSRREREYFDSLPERSRDLVEAAVADKRMTSATHLATILSLDLAPSALDFVMQDNCFVCHSDPESHTPATLLSADPGASESPAHMNLRELVNDVHFRRGLSCAGCHGGDPTEPMGHDFPPGWPESAEQRHSDRGWIPGFCARCHSDATYMRQFDPTLPTDQLAKYTDSRHGKLLLEAHDSRAAQCVSCHGAHGIQGPASPRSKIYPQRVPETCAACHSSAVAMSGFTLADGSRFPTDQYESYRKSVHGRALLEHGDLGAPACNDCHGNHAAMPPEVASVAQVCRTCHTRNGTLFDGSKHKQQFEAHGWPECGKCHGNHAIAKTSDAMLAPGEHSLCRECHASYARDNRECDATAAYFHEQITALATAFDAASREAEQLARRGLDVDPMSEELDRLFDSIKQSRSYVHAFERSEFDQAAEPGRASIGRMEELKTAAQEELGYRLRGLWIAGAFISLTMLLLWHKLRSIERANAAFHAGDSAKR